MKFTASFSALLVVVSFIADVSALAVPADNGALAARQNRGGRNRGGNRGGQAQQGQGQQANQGKANQGQQANQGKANQGQNNAGQGAAAGNANQGNNNAGNGGNAAATQDSLTIDPRVVQTTGTGQNPPVAGQSNALVSKNNFANFCALTLPQTPITNGLQTTTGSCNPTPIGLIPAVTKMPSGKFQSPKNGDTIAANTPFTISLAVKNIQLGDFTNAQQTYFANPQTLNAQGEIIGHTHVVIEAIPSLDTTQVTDPQKFIFFKGINGAQNGQGIVTADVTAGVPPGTYRLGTIMSSATHQPCIVPVAQHGLLDDVVYFTATAGGAAAGGKNNNAGGNGNNAAAGGAAAGGAAAGGAANAGNANKGNANANAGNANAGKGNANAGKGNANAGKGNAQGGNRGQANAKAAAAAKAAAQRKQGGRNRN